MCWLFLEIQVCEALKILEDSYVEMLMTATSFCFVGIAAFYKDFVEALYENLGGQASITGNCNAHFALYGLSV